MKDAEASAGTSIESGGRSRPVVALTMGDANGIGPEIILKCLSDSRLLRMMRPVVVGSLEVIEVHARRLGFEAIRFVRVETGISGKDDDRIPLVDVSGDDDVPVEFGCISAAAGMLAMKAVAEAVRMCLSGEADAMVTAPISKKAISLGGYSEPGHTEFIASRCGASRFTMMMVADRLRIALVTGHVPIWDVPKRINQAEILKQLSVLDATMKADFGLDRPRIAVLALNPHAGEEGILGKEEMNTITPALEKAKDEGIQAVGPFPADGFFGASTYLKFDAVLAMYHDQGLVPFKTLAFDSGVNFTAGLPIVRTSPDHGTAYDIAGQGKASPDSMRSAIYLAVDVARRRAAISD